LFDVDTPDDLRRQQTALEAGPAAAAGQTARFLASWRR
jgi:hypothetical protein